MRNRLRSDLPWTNTSAIYPAPCFGTTIRARKMAFLKLAETRSTNIGATQEPPGSDLQAWVALAKRYVAHLSRLDARASQASAQGIAAVEIQAQDQTAVCSELKTIYSRIAPGDIVVVSLPDGLLAAGTSQRDALGRALFQAGFERPIIWAGRKILVAETDGSQVHRLLSSAALGAGPHAGVANGAPEIASGQLIAIAVRSALHQPDSRDLRVSVVMPVYNEKTTFRQVVESLLEKQIPGFNIEVCIVESNSSDGTRDEVLKYKNHPRVRLLLEDRAQGKGHAVRNGLQLATGDIILIQDADLEYALEDYEKLLTPIAQGKASFVLGSRHPVGESGWQLRQFAGQRRMSDILNVGHLFFTWLLNVIFCQSLRDPFTMYKVFRRDCIQNIRFECNRFDFDVELVAKLVRNGFSPMEIDVHYHSRSFREGKKVSLFRDPPTWIKACLRHRFSSLHIWPV